MDEEEMKEELAEKKEEIRYEGKVQNADVVITDLFFPDFYDDSTEELKERFDKFSDEFVEEYFQARDEELGTDESDELIPSGMLVADEARKRNTPFIVYTRHHATGGSLFRDHIYDELKEQEIEKTDGWYADLPRVAHKGVTEPLIADVYHARKRPQVSFGNGGAHSNEEHFIAPQTWRYALSGLIVDDQLGISSRQELQEYSEELDLEAAGLSDENNEGRQPVEDEMNGQLEVLKGESMPQTDAGYSEREEIPGTSAINDQSDDGWWPF